MFNDYKEVDMKNLRYYFNPGTIECQWRHPAEYVAGLIDVTNFSDSEFDALFVTWL